MNNNSNHEQDNVGGCMMVLAFPVACFWIWFAMFFVDIRLLLGGLVGSVVSGFVFFKVRSMKDMLDRFHVTLIIACVTAAIVNLLMGVSVLKAILIPLVMLPGVVVTYMLYYNVKNDKWWNMDKGVEFFYPLLASIKRFEKAVAYFL